MASELPEASPTATTERSLEWVGDAVLAIDQRALPHEQRRLRLESVDDVIEAIATLAIRGAPAIGVAGAFGVALSARLHERDGTLDVAAVGRDAERLIAARPTAVNLAWAVRRVCDRLAEGADAVLAEAHALVDEDERVNAAAAGHAADLLIELCGAQPLRVATHCNTGRLATLGRGTALGAIAQLDERGCLCSVLIGETRPLLQGARLTTWELAAAGIEHRLCVDAAVPAAIAQGMVDCVVVGADRVAANADVANKIGTYPIALAAARQGIPFVVVAPESSIDRSIAGGDGIEIEERSAAEVLEVGGRLIAPAGTAVYNPAFDVTPAALVTAVVSERGLYVTPDGVRGSRASAGAHATDRPRREAVVSVSRELYRRGWMDGTSGNVSARAGAQAALITAGGLCKGGLCAGDVVYVRLADGAPLASSAPRPSGETPIHVALYRCQPGCGAVVHAHPPYATALTSRLQGDCDGAVRIAAFQLTKGLGLEAPEAIDVPVIRDRPDPASTAAAVERRLGDAGSTALPVLLLAAHGAFAWGRDLEQARNRLECLEMLCRLQWMTDGPPACSGREALGA
jgi:methylthioribose-1-phosphate isomerase